MLREAFICHKNPIQIDCHNFILIFWDVIYRAMGLAWLPGIVYDRYILSIDYTAFLRNVVASFIPV